MSELSTDGTLRGKMIDLKDLPSCPLEARVLLVHERAAQRARLAVDYIKTRYPKSHQFEEASGFVDHHLLDCMRSDFDSLGRVWFFPAIEAAAELSECLNRLLDCSYKASRDNMRRALELILVGVYFSHSHISKEEAKRWLNSTRDTPYFARALKSLLTLPRFELLDADHNWAGAIKQLYRGLSDTVHTKGQRHSLRDVQPFGANINCISVPEFHEDALRASLDLYLETVSQIAVILAAYNPILLVGLPLLQKFGDNPPLSGFYEEPQAETLWALIPARYHSSLRRIVKTDEEVLSVLEWIDSLPDKF